MSINRCIVCDSEKSSPIYTGILKCDNCGYIYADLHLSNSEFEKLYNAGYFTGEEYSDYLSDKEIIQKNFDDRINTLMKYIKPDEHQSLLEVGAAYGFFLELAEKHYKYVVGIDITKEGIEYAKGSLNLNAYCQDLLEWDFESRVYNVVCLWDTIEHLKSPDEYFGKIAENMSTGGLLVLTTPDIGSLVAKLRKNRWRMIHPPTHAHYFSKKSITQFLDKYGYNVIHFEHSGIYRSVGMVSYILFKLRWNMPWLYNFIELLSIGKLGFYTNLYDVMYVIARRR